MGIVKRILKPVGDVVGSVLGVTGAGDAVATAQSNASYAATKAAATQAQVDKDAAANQATLNEINKNYAADLTSENRVKVEAGGTAAVADDSADSLKKRLGTGLSSTLGLNT